MSSVKTYVFERFVLVIGKYFMFLSLISQIILNYQLKSCNSITWKLIVVLLIANSFDNTMVLISPSFADTLYYLKEGNFIS